MGHRSSKSAITNASTSADLCINHNNTKDSIQTAATIANTTATTTANRPTELWNSNGGTNSSNRIPIPLPGTTINVQIQESPTIDVANNQLQSESDSSSINSLQNRQIIIKIQLAKMEENANDSTATVTGTTTLPPQEVAAEASALTLDSNNLEASGSSSTSGSKQIVNLTLNGNFIYTDEGSELASLSSTSSRNSRTAGGSTNLTKNNNNKNNLNKSTTLEQQNSDLQIRLNALHIQEDWEQQQSNDALPEYCEVLEESICSAASAASETYEPRRSETSLPDTVGCLSTRRKSSKTSARPSSTSSLSSVMLSRRRCRDAIRRILEPTSKSSSSKNKQQQQNTKHSENITPPPLPALPLKTNNNNNNNKVLPSISNGRSDQRRQSLNQNQQNQNNATTSNNNIMPISITTVGGGGNAGATTSHASGSSNAAKATTAANQLSTAIWTPSHNDLIIPITSPPQFVVVQCAPSSVVTLGRIDDNAIRLTSTDVGAAVNGFNVNSNVSNAFTAAATKLTRSMSTGPIVHSQVDFVHCLVPDLDKIVNSSFYWGKIDRYEAERLLEGKPEGTFLLRDSAQEEYLFSVTFRKYGRSLHARIEQSGHKFGFDCHDPGVFTAPTVTGLLQHYKDPACVMFFEPMLTIPLHRKTVFSLQELARASIVSNTTYDGINELGLPVRVKSFLKEYHYKQKLRVKPCDEPFYACT